MKFDTLIHYERTYKLCTKVSFYASNYKLFRQGKV